MTEATNTTESTMPASAASPAVAAAPAKPRKVVGVRRVKMTISRIDVFSAVKLAFLLSVAIGIMIVIATMVLWFVLDSMHVWAQIDELLVTLNSEALLKLGQFMEFGRVVSFSVVVGVIEIVLATALGAILAVLYNLVAAMVGGMHVTMTDE